MQLRLQELENERDFTPSRMLSGKEVTGKD